MIRSIVYIIIVLAISLVSVQPGQAEDELTGYQIMERVDNRPIPVDMTSEMTMNLIDKKGRSRNRTLKTNRMGDEKQIMWFLEPADVKGSSFLRLTYDDRDDDMWIYLPAFGKVRRIASHARNGSFMGSDFTYEDMEKIKLSEYDFEFLREEDLNGTLCWVVLRSPKEGVKKDFSKVIAWISKENDSPQKSEIYDRKGRLKKIMTFDQMQVDKYWVAKQITMETLKSKHKTELIFDNIQVDTGLEENIFQSSYMTRIH